MKTLALGRAALAAYDFGFLEDRYSSDYPNHAPAFDRYTEELRKFLELPLHCDGPLAAMSNGVDALWHTFINHTPQYAAFCDDVYGEFLHHQPRSEKFPVPVEAISNTYTLFPKIFGPMGDTWFEDIPPAHVIAVRNGQVPSAVQQLKWSGWPGR
jgi:hypothetical protein